METLAAYMVGGILIAGAYDEMTSFCRLTYAFLFPVHWVLMTWFRAIGNARGNGILNNGPLWTGLFVIFFILTLVSG